MKGVVNINRSNNVIMLGSTETEVRQRQHDANPGKVIVDIFCRGIEIPDEELSEELRETVQDICAKLNAQEIVQNWIKNDVF